jgi:hypothetical protein
MYTWKMLRRFCVLTTKIATMWGKAYVNLAILLCTYISKHNVVPNKYVPVFYWFEGGKKVYKHTSGT